MGSVRPGAGEAAGRDAVSSLVADRYGEADASTAKCSELNEKDRSRFLVLFRWAGALSGDEKVAVLDGRSVDAEFVE
ncbi:hypothetical protein HPP92_016021 [Vanilla planifolia]|uniref:Uncharacterized protein n=1 Tax=Vanilla planifolia TaxID=51239 RepID=A0A835QQI7_VANPL|nr:hypothetical protein HPP92_016021 [Vanilla planifolia]